MKQEDKHLQIRNSELKNIIDYPNIIDLNISNDCTRKCEFCPHSKMDIPKKFIKFEYIQEIAYQLINCNFKNIICVAGHGEPTCHPQFIDIIKTLLKIKTLDFIEVVSNCDNFLSNKLDFNELKDLPNLKFSFSSYSQAHFDKINKRFGHLKNVRINKFFEKDYKLFTNRGGVLDKNDKFKNNYCYIPFYKININIDGFFSMCCQDWSNKNDSELHIMETDIQYAWDTFYSNSRYIQLRDKKRPDICKNCDINGELVGKEIFDIWKDQIGI